MNKHKQIVVEAFRDVMGDDIAMAVEQYENRRSNNQIYFIIFCVLGSSWIWFGSHYLNIEQNKLALVILMLAFVVPAVSLWLYINRRS